MTDLADAPPQDHDLGHANEGARRGAAFLTTKEYRRFTELCDSVRRDRYIGLCYGPPGVGKTLSARHYCGWDAVDAFLNDSAHRFDPAPPQAMTARAVFYTPTVTTTPRKLDSEIGGLIRQFHWAIEDTLHPAGDDEFIHHRPISKSKLDSHTELLIVDEADRLKTAGLEQLRDYHDRLGIGLILIGMPGLERRLARYPQLYSRIGFAHEYRPLSTDELAFVLTHHWRVLGLTFSADDFTDTEALATVGRVTNGNFRLVERLFAQIARILEINNLRSITREVVETAREALVIGTT